ncbi:hypothetical protein [Niallia sp. 01092]|uniref:hypothetical protein n=1 Tax=unclassified Niallia TaxID=2837522 RepID=UPI003FD2AFD0
MNENSGSRSKTITIKINGKERSFQRKDKEENSTSFVEAKKDSQDKNFTEEIAAGSETIGEESFDWILPNDEPVEEITELPIPEQETKKKASFFDRNKRNTNKKTLPKGMVQSIFFTVLFAVILGTGFGFILLNIVSSDQKASAPTTSAALQTNTTDKIGTTTRTTVAVKKEISTYMVQHIILSKAEAVNQEQSQLLKKGYVSQRIDIDGKMIIYLAAASNIDDAKKMQKEIQENNVAAFAKEITFSGGKVNDISKNEKSFIERSPDIYAVLTSAVTAAQFDQSIPNDVKEELKKQQASLNQLKVKEFKHQQIKSMAAELSTSLANAMSLSGNSSKEELQSIQKSLLAFLGEYSTL